MNRMRNDTRVGIELTRKQYRNLLKLQFIGEWIFQSHKTETDPDMDDLQQLLYSYTRDFDSGDWVEYDTEFKQYFSTSEMEEDIHLIIDDFSDENFWDELIHRLAFRDFLLDYKDSIDKMNAEERISKQQPYLEKYDREFSKNGLKNLFLKK